MARKFGALMAGLGMLAIVLSATAGEDKVPAIKDVMKAVAGKGGLCAKCGGAGKDSKWEDAQKYAKTMTECCAALAKNKCPKGDADSWKKLSTKFADDAAAVSKAAEAKDATKFTAALKTFTGSCKACHDAHK